jgi:hypothetical protein
MGIDDYVSFGILRVFFTRLLSGEGILKQQKGQQAQKEKSFSECHKNQYKQTQARTEQKQHGANNVMTYLHATRNLPLINY